MKKKSKNKKDKHDYKLTIDTIANFLAIPSSIISLLALIFTFTIESQTDYISRITAPCVYAIEYSDDNSGDLQLDGEDYYYTNCNITLNIKPEKGSIADIGNILVGKNNEITRIDSWSLMEHQQNNHIRSEYLENNHIANYMPTSWNYIYEKNIIYNTIFVKTSEGQTDIWLIIKDLNDNTYITLGYDALTNEHTNKGYDEAIESYKLARKFVLENKI